MRTALVFGSSTGTTEDVARRVQEAWGSADLEVLRVDEVTLEDLKDRELLIITSPTLDYGDLHPDWYDLYDQIADADLSNVKAVFIGLGDQSGYPDTFQDAMGLLHERFQKAGAQTGLGYTETSGYDFDSSKAMIDGKFCGLAIDEDQQPELTDQRITDWVAQLRRELG